MYLQVVVCVRCRILGYYGHFCPQTQAHPGIIKHRVILFDYPPLTDGSCLFMDTAGKLSIRVIINCAQALQTLPAGHILSICPCPVTSNISPLFGGIKNPHHCSIHQRLLAGPVPVVLFSNMALDRPVQCTLVLSGFHYQGYAGKIQFCWE